MKIENPSLVYCNDVQGLIDELKPGANKDEEWRLFIDSSKRNLKGVLLHNMNKFAPIPISHSTVLKEADQNVEFVLKKIKYSEFNWKICWDVKILGLVLGQQSGFTKNPCFCVCGIVGIERITISTKNGQREFHSIQVCKILSKPR